jgi:hypothetical protein
LTFGQATYETISRMSSRPETVPVAYETPREWLEGKRRFVQTLRQFCGIKGDDWRPRRDAAPVADREVLDAALQWHEEEHLVREIQTQAAGIRLPIDDFAESFGLDAVEREVVELLLVAATDLVREDGRSGLKVSEVVQLLACGRRDGIQEFLPYFLPGSRLLSAVKCQDGYSSRRLSLDENIVATLLGVECSRPQAKAAQVSWDGDIAERLSSFGVVLGPAALESIRSLWGYVRRLDVIREKWGFGSLSQGSGGVCVLFHGPSGTGKTLTARMLCRALGREPLVVNYPELVSKWVGETQKHTKAAFDEAAKTNKVLVFDEADAVFARRTEVQSACDRLANSEVNSLLMELERFPGIVILTTNHAGVFDPALERRIKCKVYFGPPDAEARSEIWRKHLPKEAPLARDVDLGRLAQEFKLTGGQIANAVLTAASLAASRLQKETDTGQIAMADFEASARRELDGYAEADKNGRLGF